MERFDKKKRAKGVRKSGRSAQFMYLAMVQENCSLGHGINISDVCDEHEPPNQHLQIVTRSTSLENFMSIIHVRHEKRSNKQFKLGCSFFIGQSLEISSKFRCFEIGSKTDESRQDGSIQSCLKRCTMVTQVNCNWSRGRLPTDHRYKLASDFRVKQAANCKVRVTCRIASSLLEF